MSVFLNNKKRENIDLKLERVMPDECDIRCVVLCYEYNWCIIVFAHELSRTEVHEHVTDQGIIYRWYISKEKEELKT